MRRHRSSGEPSRRLSRLGKRTLLALTAAVPPAASAQTEGADLGVTGTAYPIPVPPGTKITYTITVANYGPDAAFSVVVTDTLPPNTVFVSCSAGSRGSCGGSGNVRTISLPSLASAAYATVTIVAKLRASVPENVTVANRVRVASASSDPRPANNSTVARTTASTAPSFAWQTSPPGSVGLDGALLDDLRAQLAARRTSAFLVFRHDRLAYEWYRPGWGRAVPHSTASLAKSLVGGMSLLVAMDDGRLAPSDFARGYIPQWVGDPDRSAITVGELATHTSGMEDAEPKTAGWKKKFWDRCCPDPFTVAITLAPIVFPPGTDWRYSNPGFAALAYAVTASLATAPERDIRTLLAQRVMNPIGVTPGEWSIGYRTSYLVDGMSLQPTWGGGKYSPNALALIGRLMLRGGDWGGRQLVGFATVNQATRGGLGWWKPERGPWPSLPPDAYFGWGAGDQILLVVPSLDLIMVRNGSWLEGPDEESDALEAHLFGPLMDAVEP